MAKNNKSTGLLAALFGAIFAAAAGTHALTPIFPELKAALGVGDGAVRQLTACFTLAYSVSGFLLGMLCDRLGRRRVLLASLWCYAAASGCLLLPGIGFEWFLLLRVLAGLGTGGITAAVLACVADAVPFARRGRAMSFVLSGSYVAVVVGVPVASLLAQVRLTAVFGLLAAVSAGAALALPRLSLIDRSPGRQAGPLLLLPLRALACRGARAALGVTFLNSVAVFAVITSLADHCVDRFAASLVARSALFLGLGLGALPGALLAGLAADRFGKRRSVLLALWGCIVLTPVLLLPRGFGTFVAAAVAVSFVQALRQGPFAAILTELAEPGLRGSLVGSNSAAAGLGLAAGTWLGGVTYARAGLAGGVVVALAALVAALCLFGLGVPEGRQCGDSVEVDVGSGRREGTG